MVICLMSSLNQNLNDSQIINSKSIKMDSVYSQNTILKLDHKSSSNHSNNVVMKNGLVPFVARNLPLKKKYEENLYDLCLKIAKININEECTCNKNENEFKEINSFLRKKENEMRYKKLSSFVKSNSKFKLKKKINQDYSKFKIRETNIDDLSTSTSIAIYNPDQITLGEDCFDQNEDLDFSDEFIQNSR